MPFRKRGEEPPPEVVHDPPGTVRRSYLHEGWTISLRCE